MKTTLFIIALAISFNSCNAQEKNKSTSPLSAENEIEKKEPIQPRGSWSVTREVDENGNLIRYDSIYSYSYSSANGETGTIKNVDSVIQSFRNYFDDRIPENWNKSFMNPYWNDSLRFDDFFNEDYFHDRWKHDFFDMESRFRYMDSLRIKYFQDFYPGLYKNQNEKEHLQDG